jgi:hypothetical protein
MPRRLLTPAAEHCFWSARGAFRLKVDRDSIIACAECKIWEEEGRRPGGSTAIEEGGEEGEQKSASNCRWAGWKRCLKSFKMLAALITRSLIGWNGEYGRNRLFLVLRVS